MAVIHKKHETKSPVAQANTIISYAYAKGSRGRATLTVQLWLPRAAPGPNHETLENQQIRSLLRIIPIRESQSNQ
jgi:hypothetical protein